MSLEAPGEPTSVNAREWIALWQPSLGRASGTIVLPPDAGPDAGPLPVPGCPLFDRDPSCTALAAAMSVGETDWLYAEQIIVTPSGFEVPVSVAIGPAGEILELVAFGSGEAVSGIEPGPGPIFFGYDDLRTGLPVVWRTPGLERESLPAGGFAEGPVPQHSDEVRRIVGAGIAPELPVLWTPAADGSYPALDVLPLLEGGTSGGAFGIDGVIAGWSDDTEGARRAVVWILGDSGVAVRALPTAAGAVACPRAVATSERRVAGECVDEAGAFVGVVWLDDDRDGQWAEVLRLEPLPGDAAARVVAMSGDLVVGRSEGDGPPRAVAWRLPAVPAGG